MRWNDRIGRRIKLSDLHILLAVAQSGSMAKAANELAISHPVVSRSISELKRHRRLSCLPSGKRAPARRAISPAAMCSPVSICRKRET